MYRIEKISVNNFKNIVNTNLELGDMNVIVGPNNSGKSNFLQVIPFLRFIQNGDIEELRKEFNLKQGKFVDEYIPKWLMIDSLVDFHITIRIDYKELKTNTSFTYEVDLHILNEENKSAQPVLFGNYTYKFRPIEILKESLFYKQNNKTGKAVRIFERDKNEIKAGESIKGFINPNTHFFPYASLVRYLSLLIPDAKENSIVATSLDGINEILKSPIFYFSVSELKKKANENPTLKQNERIIWTDIAERIYDIDSDSQRKDYFDKIIKEILNIDEVLVLFSEDDHPDLLKKKDIELLFRQKKSLKSLEEFSDGTILLITLITEILSNKNDIIFIEEPENSIHPKALQELIKFMQEFEGKKQFIITTHSSTLLNIIKDPGNIIIADVNEKGESTLRKPKDVKALRKKLSKGFLSLGDLLYFNIDQEPAEKENDTTIY